MFSEGWHKVAKHDLKNSSSVPRSHQRFPKSSQRAPKAPARHPKVSQRSNPMPPRAPQSDPNSRRSVPNNPNLSPSAPKTDPTNHQKVPSPTWSLHQFEIAANTHPPPYVLQHASAVSAPDMSLKSMAVNNRGSAAGVLVFRFSDFCF